MTLYRWQATITDEAGNVMPGAVVTVRNEVTGLLPPLFADKAGLVPIDNPFTLANPGNGEVAFYVTPGFYEISAILGTLIAQAQDANVGTMNASIFDPEGVEADTFDSTNIRYDGTASGLTAVTVQEAIDETIDRITFTGAIVVLATGAALPVANGGPLYHYDYADTMTWQAYSANGAAYTGYASDGIGDLVPLGRSTPRRGTLKLNGADISTTTYAALYGWAKHNGLMDSAGAWVAGTLRFRENGSGTFRLPDMRGEALRAWDDGRGVDSGRALGSWQDHQGQTHTHTASQATFTGLSGADAGTGYSFASGATSAPASGNWGAETRMRNVSFLAAIKF